MGDVEDSDHEKQSAIHPTCIQDLPDGCLSLIVQLLKRKIDRDSFALTCRRWLAIESISRHSLRIIGPNGIPSDAEEFRRQLHSAFGRFPAILQLSLIRCTLLPNSSFKAFQSGCTRLKTLELPYCLEISNAGLGYIAQGCPALSRLSLQRCCGISDTGLQSIAEGCRDLESLDLAYCENVTDTGVEAVAIGCTKLAEMTISYCGRVEGWGLRPGQALKRLYAEACKLSNFGLKEGLSGATALECLDMGNMRSGIKLGPGGLGVIGEATKLLQELCLKTCRVLDDNAVQVIAQGCRNLRVCDMAVCPEVTFRGWQAIAVFSTKLHTLHAYRCWRFCDNSLLALQNGSPSLHTIYVHGCPALSQLALDRFQLFRPAVRIRPYENFELVVPPQAF